MTLAQVNDVVNASPATFKAILRDMLRMPVNKVLQTAVEIARGKDSEETRNILSNLVRHGSVVTGKPLALITGQSDFRFEELYARTITVFLIVPEEKLAIYSPFLRVMAGLALNGVFRAGRTRCRHQPNGLCSCSMRPRRLETPGAAEKGMVIRAPTRGPCWCFRIWGSWRGLTPGHAP